MITIANPIYDSVFKFLMEDERVARTILSALLKMDITKVEMRPHEYSNSQRDALSMFRIDFAATVRQSDGSEKIILIEVQKTWIETETLRFRQYLGVQYQRKENIQPGSKEGFAIPMVAVYILGHKVGDIEEPVIYVEHEAYDYNRNLVVRGLPNAFVDSLTHDSIIVQIPLLHGQVNNRLDKVLSVFDQNLQDKNNKHVLNIDESFYAGDADMELIVGRLVAAASDAKMRHDMNVEDEYFSVIEKRDTTIMLQDKKIAEQTVKIAEKEKELAEQTVKIAKKDKELAEKDEKLAEKDEKLAEKDEKLAEKDEKLAEKDAMLRMSVKMLMDAGMPAEQVAVNLNMDMDTLYRLIDK
jgi:hypothetical protein